MGSLRANKTPSSKKVAKKVTKHILMNRSLDKQKDVHCLEWKKKLDEKNIKCVVWDADYATLCVAAPASKGTKEEQTQISKEADEMRRNIGTPSHVDAQFCLIKSDDDVLANLLRFVKNDIESIADKSMTRYVLLTAPSDEICNRVRERNRRHDNCILSSPVVGPQQYKLETYFKVFDSCDDCVPKASEEPSAPPRPDTPAVKRGWNNSSDNGKLARGWGAPLKTSKQ